MIKNLYGNAVETGVQTGNVVASGSLAFASGETIVADVLTLPAEGVFELISIERTQSTGAFRGVRKILISSPTVDLYGSESCKHYTEASSDNTGVTISYHSDSTIEIKPSSTTYSVDYQVTQIM